MGGTEIAAAAAIAASAGSFAIEETRRRDNLKAERRKIIKEEEKRKNILEEQLARRRAITASTGSPDSKSFTASQNRIVRDSINNMYSGGYTTGEQLNNWTMSKNLLDAGQNLSNKSMIK